MASRVSQTFLFTAVLICFLLVSSSGPARGFTDPLFACQGPCSGAAPCNQLCINKGFPKGGNCVSFRVSDPPQCCCTT
ncbi:hypothetical protein K1719_028772 [Acacia pycnantha]|nr:hypothetical protein K1719_028772 [Acacia pycnantha]